MCSSASCWWTLALNFHNPQASIMAAAVIISTFCGKGLLNNVFCPIIMVAYSATFLTQGSRIWSIPLDLCARLVSFASWCFGISISGIKFLLWTQRASMECHGHEDPFARILALRGTNRTRCRCWQGIMHGWQWWGGGWQVSGGCFL